MIRGFFHWLAVFAVVGAVAGPAFAGEPATARELLDKAKRSTGGAAWDALRSQHSKVRITTAAGQGTAERWASVLTGRSRLHLELEGASADLGFDGFVVWSRQDGSDVSIETDPATLQLAANTAYRDRLAFWFPDRHAAKIAYAGQRSADGAEFDVVTIVPEGGIEYEVWIARATGRIERIREPEYATYRTEIHADFRPVQGVMVPFSARVLRDDSSREERYAVDVLEYNVPLEGVDFAPPRPK
jgi:hypothetical protein